eukprot:TRINITY_DN8658_c0_g2_i2.p1 TRINITY_DN8658_c0_g2~~TRINITY_DN8658_c0_g2_i2.p1  ORF type:complete len:587 (+),score=135.74 TRINITY_DN8658_c0_g2_i2:82-1761(+)
MAARSDTSDAAGEALWSRFREATAADFAEEDILLMSLDTFKALVPYYGFDSPVERARIEVQWRLLHKQQELRQRQQSPPQARDVAPLRSPAAQLPTPAEAAAAAAAAARAAVLQPSPQSARVSPRRAPASPPRPPQPSPLPCSSPGLVCPQRPMTGLLSPARPPSPEADAGPSEAPQPARRSQGRSPSAGASVYSYPAVHPQEFAVPPPAPSGPSLSRRRRLAAESNARADPNTSAHEARNVSPAAGIRSLSGTRQAQCIVAPNLRVTRDDAVGSPSRKRKIFAQHRRKSVADIAGDHRPGKRGATQQQPAVPSNPNVTNSSPLPSQRRSRGAVLIENPATGDPNIIPGALDVYAREMPTQSEATAERRRKGNQCRQMHMPGPAPAGVRIPMPKRGAVRSRSNPAAPATSDPNEWHEGKEEPLSCRRQTRGRSDNGVVPPFVGPGPLPRASGAGPQQDQGVLPGTYAWRAREGSRSPLASRRAHVPPPAEKCVEAMRWPQEAELPPSPTRRRQVTGAQMREEMRATEARERPLSPSRRRRVVATPPDKGVMPGAYGWTG